MLSAELLPAPRMALTGLGTYPPFSSLMLLSCLRFSSSGFASRVCTDFSARSTQEVLPSSRTWRGSSFPGVEESLLLPLPRIDILTFPPALATSSLCLLPPGPMSSPMKL